MGIGFGIGSGCGGTGPGAGGTGPGAGGIGMGSDSAPTFVRCWVSRTSLRISSMPLLSPLLAIGKRGLEPNELLSNQLGEECLDGNAHDSAGGICHSVREEQIVAMNQVPARVDHVGHIACAFFLGHLPSTLQSLRRDHAIRTRIRASRPSSGRICSFGRNGLTMTRAGSGRSSTSLRSIGTGATATEFENGSGKWPTKAVRNRCSHVSSVAHSAFLGLAISRRGRGNRHRQ
jgi:hypothetical protein